MLVPKCIEVKTDLHSVVVSVDRVRFRRVIENLVRNAVEAMSCGGFCWFLYWFRGDMVVVSVKDTGVGIIGGAAWYVV